MTLYSSSLCIFSDLNAVFLPLMPNHCHLPAKPRRNLLGPSFSGCSTSPFCSFLISAFMFCMSRWWLLQLFQFCATKIQPSIALIYFGLKYPFTDHSLYNSVTINLTCVKSEIALGTH